MRLYTADGELQQNGCFALARLTAGTVELSLAKEVVIEGGPEALMHAMRLFPRRLELLRQATQALRSLVTSTALSTEFLDESLITTAEFLLTPPAARPTESFRA